MDELTKDMCNLAKMVYDISKKHGGIHIEVSKHIEFKQVRCIYEKDNQINNIEYWARTKQFTRNLIEKIKF